MRISDWSSDVCSSDLEERRPVIDGCEFHEALQAVAVSGGVAGNVVPDVASVTINRRFAPDRSADEAEAEVRALLATVIEAGATIEVVVQGLASSSWRTNPLLRALHDGPGLCVSPLTACAELTRSGGAR